MSGSFESLDVPPTLVSFAVGMTKASKTISAAFTKAGSKVVYLPLPEELDTLLPNWEKLKEYYASVYQMMENGSILSASVVKEGGVAAAVAKMCFGNGLGFVFEEDFNSLETLFAPKSGALVVELSYDAVMGAGLEPITIGFTSEAKEITINGTALSLDTLCGGWMDTLEPIFPSKAEETPISTEIALYTERNTKAPAIKAAKPRVFIPVFPGTNCEVDTARAFELAGAEPEILIVKNLSSADIEETIERMAAEIAKAQIVMLPGGFSGGDEPDGSGKFIATTFRNPKIAEEVTKLLEQRDGLMLGICNGFQALIKLGLVPYGKITELDETSPTLTFNKIGRHVSRMVYTRVTSVKSPWLSGVEAGDVHCVPVSHGEGRFVANDDVLAQLIANGQVATQYTTPCGKVSSKIEWNPNGSVCAIEGITSPDGRVFGKMAHSERKGDDLYKNVPGAKDQKIFESGVKYFK